MIGVMPDVPLSECGYRGLDIASRYGNETGVGRALRACGLPREKLFVTMKLWSTSTPRNTP
jgi:2,5-diketo-D-gluconate reductase A